jgi:hypothetical protein
MKPPDDGGFSVLLCERMFRSLSKKLSFKCCLLCLLEKKSPRLLLLRLSQGRATQFP